MTGDILEKDCSASSLSNKSSDVRPEMSWIVTSATASCQAEWLARVSANDKIHDVTKGVAVEGSNIRPDRRRSQPAFFHARSQDRAGKGFDLRISDVARIEAESTESGLDSEVKAASTGGDGQDVDRGKIHTV